MKNISININPDGKGAFALMHGRRVVGRIGIALLDGELMLLDTVVPCRRKLFPIGLRILAAAVEYARMHELKVITVSKFVQRRFSSHAVLYADIWEKAF